jgi:hypothetical protein
MSQGGIYADGSINEIVALRSTLYAFFRH